MNVFNRAQNVELHIAEFFERFTKMYGDSRCQRTEETLWHPVLGECVRTYCANCHKPFGQATKEGFDVLVVLCNDCYQKHGHLPLPQVDEAVLKGVYIP